MGKKRLRSHCCCSFVENPDGKHKLIYTKTTPKNDTWIILGMKEYWKSPTDSAVWYLRVVTTFPGAGQTEGCFFGNCSFSGKSINPLLILCMQLSLIPVMASQGVLLSPFEEWMKTLYVHPYKEQQCVMLSGQKGLCIPAFGHIILRRCAAGSLFLLCFPGCPHRVATQELCKL